MRALSVANCGSIIKKIPKGVHTIVGEKGVRLSGGEKQRIGIARAVYADPQIFLFDESTSHLDSKTEKTIQQNIDTKLKNKTVILIAHRLSTLRNVNRILVIHRGRIIEQGSYQQLLQKKGKFYSMYHAQKHARQ